MAPIRILITTVSLTFFSVLTGCAESSLLVTGQVREPLDPQFVTIFTEPPKQYSVIGLVTAKGKNAVTFQNKQDFAIQEIKQRAASIGANGVLIDSIGEQTVVISGVYNPTTRTYSSGTGTEVVVTGKAIFVPYQ